MLDGDDSIVLVHYLAGNSAARLHAAQARAAAGGGGLHSPEQAWCALFGQSIRTNPEPSQGQGRGVRRAARSGHGQVRIVWSGVMIEPQTLQRRGRRGGGRAAGKRFGPVRTPMWVS
jgi:hypothetical protein